MLKQKARVTIMLEFPVAPTDGVTAEEFLDRKIKEFNDIKDDSGELKLVIVRKEIMCDYTK